MHCTLDIELTQQTLQQKQSSLAQLLAKADVVTVNSTLEQHVLNQFALSPKTSVATIAAKADGLADEDCQWLYATPVHLILQRDTFVMYPEVPLKLERTEVEPYLKRLNQHFEPDGLNFQLGRSGQWYVAHRSNHAAVAELNTVNAVCVAGYDISHFAPTGDSANLMQQCINEAQMLLFDFEGNTLRESKGLLALNSLWLHGAGIVSESVKGALVNSPYILSKLPFYQGLSDLHLSGRQILPKEINAETISAVLSNLDQDNLRVGLSHDDDLEAWLVTLMQLLKRGQVQTLTLQIGLGLQVKVATLKRSHLLRFWRKQHDISYYLKK